MQSRALDINLEHDKKKKEIFLKTSIKIHIKVVVTEKKKAIRETNTSEIPKQKKGDGGGD